MIRKLILGAVAAAAVGFGGASATAGDPVRGPLGGYPDRGYYPPQYPRQDYDYVVLVKRGWSWERYGRFETRREAERAERFLESRGLRARIEVVEDRRRW